MPVKIPRRKPKIKEIVDGKTPALEPEVEAWLWDEARRGDQAAAFALFRAYGWFAYSVRQEFLKPVKKVWPGQYKEYRLWKIIVDAFDTAIEAEPSGVSFLGMWWVSMQPILMPIRETYRRRLVRKKIQVSLADTVSLETLLGEDSTLMSTLCDPNAEEDLERALDEQDPVEFYILGRQLIELYTQGKQREKLLTVWNAVDEHNGDLESARDSLLADGLISESGMFNERWGVIGRILRENYPNE